MEVINQKEVKTRKVHYCHGCTKEIPKGFKVTRIVSVDGGTIGTAYWCDACNLILSDLQPWQLEDGFSFGELRNYKET